MSQSNDPNHFFQTTESIEASGRRAEKSKNKNGNPLNLRCKTLAILSSESDQHVYVAGGDGQARKIDLTTNQVTQTYSGPVAPLTSLALHNDVLYAGCWDKSIHSWSASTGKPLSRFNGHTDFVKCLLIARLGSEDVLLSGSADANIIIWSLPSGRKLHTLKGHTRAVLDLALDPSSPPTEPVLFSADTLREIRRWTLTPSSVAAQGDPIAPHETSVNKLRFEPGDDDEAGDLWTASADRTAKRLVRDRGWAEDTSLEHPDYVKDVVVAGRWVVTACRDEEVRVWDASTGKLQCVYTGHFDEVTGLAVIEGGRRVVSCSLDGTVRTWSLDQKEMLAAMEQKGETKVEEEKKDVAGGMTAEEEAELAELMSDSD